MKKLILLVTLLASFSAMAAPTLESINSQISVLKTFLGHDLSCDEDSDCVAVTTGHRPCGGPSLFFITSKKNVLLPEARKMARKITRDQRAYNRANRRISHCGILNVPTPVCEAKICQ